MSITSVSSATPLHQAMAAPRPAQQPAEGAEPPAAKALEGVNDQLNAVLASVSSGLDISV